jgi:Zn-dependent peptidase ImmA (M78 family)
MWKMKQIEKLAHGLTQQYGTSSPFELCDYLGIDVFGPELPARVKGLCFQNQEGGSVILLNRTLEGQEKKFCCAHELGHVLLHPGLNAQTMADLTNLCVPRYEHEADFFAACLLIDPDLDEWSQSYDPLTVDQIACLSGLPKRVVDLRFNGAGKR